jgi:hypothetical protein
VEISGSSWEELKGVLTENKMIYAMPTAVLAGAYFLLQTVSFLISCVIFLVVCAGIIATLGFAIGFVAGVQDKLSSAGVGTAFKTIRLCQIIAPIRWGFDLGTWLMEEVDAGGYEAADPEDQESDQTSGDGEGIQS